MKGTIKNIVLNRQFGFIRAANDGEYFFHKQDFNGHWTDLVEDFGHGGPENIEVTFDVVDSPKGPRAANVRRLDWPNQAV